MILTKNGPFAQTMTLPIQRIHAKPRSHGLTMILDKGLGMHELSDLLTTGGPYVDFLKLGFGTSLLYPADVLRQKLALAKTHDVIAYPGGTLTEIAYCQNNFENFCREATEIGFAALEISDGTISLSERERTAMIATARRSVSVVLSEIGKKNGSKFSPKIMARQAERDLAAGANYVVVEGREHGHSAGIYDNRGEIDVSLFEEFLDHLGPESTTRILWEAPQKTQQVTFMKRFGSEVNLGNIPPNDLLAVESLRCGLRSDTLATAMCFSPQNVEVGEQRE
ncbi:MAG: phosphosulfolactate synthase [Alicyclobacillaceae bacterium]|nr:phosphosulfolactate synthase [Alicyclobacillaceae bacterium]